MLASDPVRTYLPPVTSDRDTPDPPPPTPDDPTPKTPPTARHEVAEGVCPNCGYNLTGSPPQGLCPECGETYRKVELLRRTPPGPLPLLAWFLWPVVAWGVIAILDFNSGDTYAGLAALLLSLPAAVITIVNAAVAAAVIRARCGRGKTRLGSISRLAYALMLVTLVLPGLYLGACFVMWGAAAYG